MAPVLMPSISVCPFCELVTDTVVLGQTNILPPRPSCNTAVSAPAVTADPVATRLPASVTPPETPEAGSKACEMTGAAG